jgi:hypothetical protein
MITDRRGQDSQLHDLAKVYRQMNQAYKALTLMQERHPKARRLKDAKAHVLRVALLCERYQYQIAPGRRGVLEWEGF